MDDARQDVERAERVWVNSEVAKLAGILAYKRGDLEMAQQKFETAAALNPDDCEIAFDRAAVFADRRDWQHAVDGFPVLSAGPTPQTYLTAWAFTIVDQKSRLAAQRGSR